MERRGGCCCYHYCATRPFCQAIFKASVVEGKNMISELQFTLTIAHNCAQFTTTESDVNTGDECMVFPPPNPASSRWIAGTVLLPDSRKILTERPFSVRGMGKWHPGKSFLHCCKPNATQILPMVNLDYSPSEAGKISGLNVPWRMSSRGMQESRMLFTTTSQNCWSTMRNVY